VHRVDTPRRTADRDALRVIGRVSRDAAGFRWVAGTGATYVRADPGDSALGSALVSLGIGYLSQRSVVTRCSALDAAGPQGRLVFLASLPLQNRPCRVEVPREAGLAAQSRAGDSHNTGNVLLSMLEAILRWLYGLSGSVTVAMYVPQIVGLVRNRSGARAMSRVMWGFWTGSAVIAVCYGWFVIEDATHAALAMGNVVGCGTIWVMAVAWRNATTAGEGEEAKQGGNLGEDVRPRAAGAVDP
jgi:hypothetical protein